MSYLKAIIKLGIAVGCLSVLACSSSKNTAKPPQGNGNTVEVDQANVDLASYLRRIPGLQISGQGDNARVTIRGSVQSLSGPSEPLFVIDNVQIGDDFASVSRLVDVHDIDKVEVLKGVDASARYGVRGSNGVVIIRTKRGGQ
ncbi:MAG: TonB-dependent receptor plug domain-containing protein [Saprospiraceae bacterium]|nr:TonB-dependent receptor plug domain-containing protein [Saprospiraceae bacterium]MCB0624162.1 TonB-dependent receptor plug domain-containing protein [Saprospiraceae bacterium]MCB0683061.1 TonB-dependent receptor plug domain-containing protein [Saprospiraceae bacterium]